MTLRAARSDTSSNRRGRIQNPRKQPLPTPLKVVSVAPWPALGDRVDEYGPPREVQVIASDGDKYLVCEFRGYRQAIKRAYVLLDGREFPQDLLRWAEVPGELFDELIAEGR